VNRHTLVGGESGTTYPGRYINSVALPCRQTLATLVTWRARLHSTFTRFRSTALPAATSSGFRAWALKLASLAPQLLALRAPTPRSPERVGPSCPPRPRGVRTRCVQRLASLSNLLHRALVASPRAQSSLPRPRLHSKCAARAPPYADSVVTRSATSLARLPSCDRVPALPGAGRGPTERPSGSQPNSSAHTVG
jgi:hypothetical protein